MIEATAPHKVLCTQGPTSPWAVLANSGTHRRSRPAHLPAQSHTQPCHSAVRPARPSLTPGWVPGVGAGLEQSVLDSSMISMRTSRKASQTEAGHGGSGSRRSVLVMRPPLTSSTEMNSSKLHGVAHLPHIPEITLRVHIHVSLNPETEIKMSRGIDIA